MSEETTGKTFICYSHKDKDRFVSDFYKKLMALRVDVSIDELDIIPGDNLPRTIFEDCINNCENFIIVLSADSIESKWVNEELDAGMIQKIEKGARLIPIVLDNLDREKIPNRLGHVYCYYIKDLTAINEDAKFIADVCLGKTQKHKPAPIKIDSTNMPKWPGFSDIDIQVLTGIIEIAMEDDEDYIDGDKLIEKLSDELSYDQIVETVEVLKSKFYIDIQKTLSGKIEDSTVEVDTQTVLYYLKYCYDDPDNKIMKPLASYVLSKGDVWLNSGEISKELNINHFLLRKLLDTFGNKEYITCSGAISSTVTFSLQIPGKRFFRDVLGD